MNLHVQVMSARMPVTVLGEDSQGRTLVACPNSGCGDTSYVDPDGRIVCPSCTPLLDHIHTLLHEGYEQLARQWGDVNA